MVDEVGPKECITDAQSFELAKLYYGAAKDASDALDSRLFWAVAGIAALSAFAAKELVPLAEATHIWLLLTGWALLLLAVLTLLIGYMVAPKNHYLWARYWLYGNECDRQATACPRAFLNALSIVALCGVVLGACSVLIFVALNL